jgi:hypothetical protein
MKLPGFLALTASTLLIALPATAAPLSGGYTAGSSGVTVGANDTSAATTSNAGTIDTSIQTDANIVTYPSATTTNAGTGLTHNYSGGTRAVRPLPQAAPAGNGAVPGSF